MWHGAYLCAKARQRCRREGGAEIDRQLTAGGRFDASEHVGGTATREIASHELGRNRDASPRKFVRGSRCGDLFAVDQHTIAIKDNHGSPRRRACSTAVVSTNRGATEGIVGPWQKSGAARPRDLFTQLLWFAGEAGRS